MREKEAEVFVEQGRGQGVEGVEGVEGAEEGVEDEVRVVDTKNYQNFDDLEINDKLKEVLKMNSFV